MAVGWLEALAAMEVAGPGRGGAPWPELAVARGGREEGSHSGVVGGGGSEEEDEH